VASVASGSRGSWTIPLDWSTRVVAQRSHGFTRSSVVSPIRIAFHSSSANGAQPVSTTFGRKRLIGTGVAPRSVSRRFEQGEGVGEARLRGSWDMVRVDGAHELVRHPDEPGRGTQVLGEETRRAVALVPGLAVVVPDAHATGLACRASERHSHLALPGDPEHEVSFVKAREHDREAGVLPLREEDAIRVHDHPAAVPDRSAAVQGHGIVGQAGAGLDGIGEEAGDANHPKSPPDAGHS
jgi:hypothetical protein